MAEENNIGVSRLLGTNSLQGAVDSFSSEVKQVTAGLKTVVGSINQLVGSNNRMSGSVNSSSYMWNASSNRNTYSANGGGAVFSNYGGGSRLGGGSANGGGGFFGNFGRGSRLSAGVGATLAVGSALTNYANKNLNGMMQQNYFGNQAALSVSGGYSQAAVNNASRAAILNNYGALSAQDAINAAYITQYASGTPILNNNGGYNRGYSAASAQVAGLAYANPTMGATAAAQTFAQLQTGRSMLMATALLGVGPRASVGQISQALIRRTDPRGMLNTQNINAALSPTGGLGATLASDAAQMGLSGQSQQQIAQYIRNAVKAKSNGISYSQFDTLMSQAGGGAGVTTAQEAAARARLQKAGIGSSAFEAQRNRNTLLTNRQEDINESMATAFINATNAVNKLTGAINSLLKNTGLDKALGLASGGLAPFANAAGGYGGAISTGASLYTAYKMFSGARGAAAGAAGAAGRMGGFFSRFGFGGMGGGGAATAGASAADPLIATAGADGVFSVAGLGGAAGGGLLAGGAATAGGVGLAGAAVGGSALLGWRQAAGQNQGGFLGALGMTLKTSPMSPFGAAYLQAGMAHRGLDWLKGTNKESFWSLLNPWGHEKNAPLKKKLIRINPQGFNPLTPGTGQQGGALNTTPGGTGNTLGNGASNMGANAAEIIHFAETQLNVPYGWGMENPGHAFDCSGLMQWAYGQAGVKIPRVAIDQRNASKRVPVNQTQPGDLLFVGGDAHHVVMNIGGGKIIEAPHTGASVRIRSLNPSEYSSAGRFVNAIGNLGSVGGGQTTPQTLSNMPGAGGDIGSYTGTSELAAIMSGLAIGMGGSMPLSSNGAGNPTNSGGSGATGTTPSGNGQNDKGSLQAYAKQLLASRGWSGQWASLNSIIMHESGWDVHATNPSSGAYGIPQSLPGNKMASAGKDWQNNGDTQLQWMMSYIAGRYGDPNKAWSYWQAHNSYDVGAWSIEKDQTAKVHAGEMIIPAKQAETIRQVLMNNMFSPNANNNRGNGATVSIGQINVQLPAGYSGTASEAQATGKMIVDAMNEQLRLRNLQVGV